MKELSDLIQNDKSPTRVVGNVLKKTGKFLYQTIKQSSDANILLGAFAASYFVPELGNMRFLLGAFAAKQYVWGHLSYNNAKRQLNKGGNVSEEVFEKVFSPSNAGLCSYCGSRYALREHKRQMIEKLNF